METLTQARRFMSAARRFARAKPIIVLKVGKSQEGAKAALYHTGSITGNNQIFDAAFKRAGILRVDSIAELFDCAKTLSMQRLPPGTDWRSLPMPAGRELSPQTRSSIKMAAWLSCLPRQWSTLMETCPASGAGEIQSISLEMLIRCATAPPLKACLQDQNVDGVLAILTPQAMTDAVAVARDLVEPRTPIKPYWPRSWAKMMLPRAGDPCARQNPRL